MAEAFRLEVEGWDSETSLQDSASESSAPGDGPSASKRRRPSLSLTRKRATYTTSTATERFEVPRFDVLDDAKSEALNQEVCPKKYRAYAFSMPTARPQERYSRTPSLAATSQPS